MIPIAPSPSNCSVRPNRGLSTRNDGSHSITTVNNRGSLSITYPPFIPAVHQRQSVIARPPTRDNQQSRPAPQSSNPHSDR